MKYTLLLFAIIFMVACNENEPPTCSIVSPEINKTYLNENEIRIVVDANDKDGVITEVRIYLNNKGLTSLKDWPYNYSLQTDDLPAGTHVIRVESFDDALASTSDSVTFIYGYVPEVFTLEATNIGIDSAILNGYYALQEEPLTDIGFYLSREEDIISSGQKYSVTDTKDTIFSLKLDTLSEDSRYFFASYAENSFGTTIGEVFSFRTEEPIFGSVEDIQGNIYRTIVIGSQVWMADNLRTTVLIDSTPIANVTTYDNWINNETTAYCWYNNDKEQYGEVFGALYNGYVAVSNKICPEGWHVPSDAEWMTLERYLGVPEDELHNLGYRGSNEGGMLKVTELWEIPNSGATNITNFNAMPGGLNSHNHHYANINKSAVFWSKTLHVDNIYFRRALSYNDARIHRSGNEIHNSGFSIRCVQN